MKKRRNNTLLFRPELFASESKCKGDYRSKAKNLQKIPKANKTWKMLHFGL